jgi:hypothetical protein
MKIAWLSLVIVVVLLLAAEFFGVISIPLQASN